MESFKSYIETMEFVDRVINEFDSVNVSPNQYNVQQDYDQKPWSAKKSEIIQMWRNIRPDVPIIIQPMYDDPMSDKKSSYGEDGIRITGSWQFIASVLARIKELIGYENNHTKLRLVFKGVDKSKASRPDRQTFVFYLNLENRKRKPKPNTIGHNPL